MFVALSPYNMIQATHDADRELAIVQVGESATATVTATERHHHYRGGTSVSVRAVYTVDGQRYQHSFWKYRVPLRDEPDIGDRFQVFYDPQDPNRAAVAAQIGRFREGADIRWFVFWTALVIAIGEVALRLLAVTIRLLTPGSAKHTARSTRRVRLGADSSRRLH